MTQHPPDSSFPIVPWHCYLIHKTDPKPTLHPMTLLKSLVKPLYCLTAVVFNCFNPGNYLFSQMSTI